MSVYRRGETYQIEFRRRGFRLRCSSGVTRKATAEEFERTLLDLWAQGRFPALEALRRGEFPMKGLHERWTATRLRPGGDAEFEAWVQQRSTPGLWILVAEWFAWMRDPATLIARRGRPFSPATIARYVCSWGMFRAQLPPGEDATLLALTPEWWDGVRRWSKAKDRTPGSLNRDATALGSFLRWCREVRHVTPGPLHLVYESEHGRARQRFLSAEELRALDTALRSPRSGRPAPTWAFLFAFLARTGLRLGEAFALRWQDVDLQDRTVTVSRTKGGHARGFRVVGLPESLAPELEERRQAVAHPFNPTAYLWGQGLPEATRVRLLSDRCRKRFWAACEEAGIMDVRIHDLRHTFAVALTKAGVPTARLQERLGHSTATMALRYARHNPNAHLQDDAAVVDDVLAGVGVPVRLQLRA